MTDLERLQALYFLQVLLGPLPLGRQVCPGFPEFPVGPSGRAFRPGQADQQARWVLPPPQQAQLDRSLP